MASILTLSLLGLAAFGGLTWRRSTADRRSVRARLRAVEAAKQHALNEITARRQLAEDQLRRLSRWYR